MSGSIPPGKDIPPPIPPHGGAGKPRDDSPTVIKVKDVAQRRLSEGDGSFRDPESVGYVSEADMYEGAHWYPWTEHFGSRAFWVSGIKSDQ